MSEGPSAWLHLHRGYGAMYMVISVVLLVIVIAGFADNLMNGSLLLAGVTILVGLALTAFLAKVGLDLVVPSLTADSDGIRGRMTLRGRPVDAEWVDVTIDVDDAATPGRFLLKIGDESVVLFGRSWFGFRDFVLLVATSARATRSLSPAASDELRRLLGIREPGDGLADRPEAPETPDVR